MTGSNQMYRSQRPDSTSEPNESIVWSAVETAIKNTFADVLLIFDCCDAGRLARPLREAHPKSYFLFLGACAADQTTVGPGEDSFTTALTWSLKELAKKGEAFSTAELRHKIMDHEKFGKTGQMPVLAERRAPYEHIMISGKGMALPKATPAASATERQKEFNRKEYIDLRFQYDHQVGVEGCEEHCHQFEAAQASPQRVRLEQGYIPREVFPN